MLNLKNIFFFSLLLFTADAFSQSKRWQQWIDYDISVLLNDKSHTLDGVVKIKYVNKSPDTLFFIWFHLWPNAYKNDKTAFSDQLLENGRTDFYFSENNERGYINRLDFRVNDIRAGVEDHPEHIDIVKVILPKSLTPGDSIRITTPFHVQLPKNYSRGGHIGRAYQLTQWYPKPAVYDHQGWHPMPYLDQGEFYSEFGNYKVEITVPAAYKVISSGVLQNPEDDQGRAFGVKEKPLSMLKDSIARHDSSFKRLLFRQENIHDFAWFASRELEIIRDTLLLESGRRVQLNAAVVPQNKAQWSEVMRVMKEAISSRNRLIGEYAYDILSIVEIPTKHAGGMEYPCIATVASTSNQDELHSVIRHEIGHNWFQGMIGNNERAFAWLDEGINTYYDYRLGPQKRKRKLYNIAEDSEEWLMRSYQNMHKNQAVNTPSDQFSETNYFLSSYYKAAKILQQIENTMGRDLFDRAMRLYFDEWKFRHPYPEDYFSVLQSVSNVRLDSLFSLFNQKGNVEIENKKRITVGILPGTFSDARSHVLITPMAGYNLTDRMMAGILFTNYTSPATNFQWLAAPMYSFKNGDIHYAARLSYTWYPSAIFDRIHVSFSGMKFNTNNFIDSANVNYVTGFRKWVPSIKFVLKSDNPRSTREKYIQWKSFFINEDRLRFVSDTFSNGNRFLKIFNEQAGRVLHQLQWVVKDTRALYPYDITLQGERSEDFTRLSATANYFYNYNAKEGVKVRFFAGKFIYNKARTFKRIFATDPFHLNLTGPRGYEDYTYSNYFIGRNEFEGFASQQIMMRDGGFKVRTDLLADKIGKTDDWLMAVNFVSDIPDNFNPLSILPFRIPLKLFLDVGTYADTWQRDFKGSKILYNAGLQIPLLKNSIHIYVPLLYSKVYREYINSTVAGNKLMKTISFSIDIQNLSLKKLDKRFPY